MGIPMLQVILEVPAAGKGGVGFGLGGRDRIANDKFDLPAKL
jgi:hypothetical protein